MAKTLVKLIAYIEVDHANGLDPRVVNSVVRNELGDDFKTILSRVGIKTSFSNAVSRQLGCDCSFRLISEPALLKGLTDS